MKETIDMVTVRKIINTQLAFEKELLEIFKAKNSHLGVYGCETAILKLSNILNSMESCKIVKEEEEIA